MPPVVEFPKLQASLPLGIFFQAYEAQMNASMLPLLTTKADAPNAIGNDYTWLGNMKGMREFIGPRQTQMLAKYEFFIKNRYWENTISIKDADYRFEKIGMIKARISEMAALAAAHPLELLTSLVISGESATCYDGQYFYDTDHAEGVSGTQSNSIQVDISALPIPSDAHGSASDPSAQEIEKTILKMIQQLAGLKNDAGKPINQHMRNFILHIPVSFMSSALAAVGNVSFPNGQVNTLVSNKSRFNIEILVDPLLTWTDKMALHRTDAMIKPFIYQEALPLQMPEPLSYSSEHYFKNDEHLFGCKAIYNVGYGLWQQSCLAQLI